MADASVRLNVTPGRHRDGVVADERAELVVEVEHRPRRPPRTTAPARRRGGRLARGPGSRRPHRAHAGEPVGRDADPGVGGLEPRTRHGAHVAVGQAVAHEALAAEVALGRDGGGRQRDVVLDERRVLGRPLTSNTSSPGELSSTRWRMCGGCSTVSPA